MGGMWRKGTRLAVCACLAACGARSGLRDPDAGRRPVDAGVGASDAAADAGADAGTCVDEPVRIEWAATGDLVDLLVVVDDSLSMAEEQANFGENLPDVVEALISPSDQDGDGIPDQPGVASIHVGVVSTDMGLPEILALDGFDPCVNLDGVLRSQPMLPGCDAAYPTFLTYDAALPDPEIARDFRCVATLGTEGCGLEQPLAAAEKAVTAQAAPGAPNDGFLRPEALLVVAILSDEDDCSIGDPAAFEGWDPARTNLVCFDHPEARRDVEEIASSLLGVKPDRPERVLVAAIVGLPPDLVGASADEVLADPRMEQRPDDAAYLLVPSCDVPGLGRAYPPRRFIELAEAIEAGGGVATVQSICRDLRPAMDALASIILGSVDSGCLPRPLQRSDGDALGHLEHADCIVEETLPDDRECSAGRVLARTDAGRTVCHVCQLGDGLPPFETDAFGNDVRECAGFPEGWAYSTTDAQCGELGKIVFTGDTPPLAGTDLRLVCTEDALPPVPC